MANRSACFLKLGHHEKALSDGAECAELACKYSQEHTDALVRVVLRGIAWAIRCEHGAQRRARERSGERVCAWRRVRRARVKTWLGAHRHVGERGVVTSNQAP